MPLAKEKDMKKVLIKMRGVGNAGGSKDAIDFATEGTMRFDGDTVILHYTEGEMMGGNVKTRVSVTGNTVAVVERTGDIRSKLCIKKNERTSAYYSIPQGDLMLWLYGKTIKNNLTENGGTLYMSYSVDTDGVNISDNEINITVSEVK